jgi:hypothetical protein
MEWVEYNGTLEHWDQLVAQCGRFHPNHLSAWVEHLPGLKRYVAMDGAVVCAGIQLVCKSKLNFYYFYSDGGFYGRPDAMATFPSFLNRNFGRRGFFYFRMISRNLKDDAVDRILLKANYNVPATKIHTGLTGCVQLTQPYTPAYTGNWRHNFARAQKRHLAIAISSRIDIQEVKTLYKELESLKGLSEQMSLEHMESLNRLGGESLVVVSARNDAGALLSVRAALCVQLVGFDIIAVTGDEGRKCYASNLVTHHLLQACAERGVKYFDFAGVDPDYGKGVAQFKQGAGATILNYQGEWEFASNDWIKKFMNVALARKLKHLKR